MCQHSTPSQGRYSEEKCVYIFSLFPLSKCSAFCNTLSWGKCLSALCLCRKMTLPAQKQYCTPVQGCLLWCKQYMLRHHKQRTGICQIMLNMAHSCSLPFVQRSKVSCSNALLEDVINWKGRDGIPLQNEPSHLLRRFTTSRLWLWCFKMEWLFQSWWSYASSICNPPSSFWSPMHADTWGHSNDVFAGSGSSTFYNTLVALQW